MLIIQKLDSGFVVTTIEGEDADRVLTALQGTGAKVTVKRQALEGKAKIASVISAELTRLEDKAP